jgi:two-component system, NarL family, response regulator DegU
MPIRVVIIDDHPIVRAGMRMVLNETPEIQIVGEGINGQEALRLAAEMKPDVLVLDVNLPDINGLEVTRRLRASGNATPVLILTVHNDSQMIFGLLKAGATGYVLKDDTLETLASAIQAVSHGETWLSSRITEHVVQRALGENKPPELPSPGLTSREMEVMCLLATGLDNEEIAQKLTLTMRTVQNHVSTIYGKLGVASRAEAILFAIRRGWVQIPSERDARYEG